MRSLREVLVSLLVCGSALAKPIYITVPRAYHADEAPVVDLAFAEKDPVELRVLKPDDLSVFIDRQFNLRRAYEPPATTANPGRALSRGLNAVRSPGDRLLMALAPEFRKQLSPSLPEREMPTPSASSLEEGPERLVGIPQGMALVRTEHLNLDLGGPARDFNVPGFEDTGWGETHEGNYQERRLALAPLPPGVYVLQLVQGMIEGQVVLVISDLTAQVKQTDGELLVRVADHSLQPLSGAQVTVHLPSGSKQNATTDAQGEARLQIREPRVVVTASSGSTAGADTTLVDTDFYSTLAITPDVFIYTDRPIYRPGDTVRFRGVVRQPDGFLARLFRPRHPQVEVVLAATEGKSVKTRATVGEFGTFSGQASVPRDLPTTVLRVTAALDTQKHQAEARVQEYVKPTFYLELLSAQENVTPGKDLHVNVRARRYAGGVPRNTAYEVYLYRTQLDSPTWVEDSGMGGQGSQVTYGSASTTEGALSIPQRLYASMQARGVEAGADAWATAAKLDAKGEAEVVVPVTELTDADKARPWRYSLSVRARDDQGAFANGSQGFVLSDTDLLAAVKAVHKWIPAGQSTAFAVHATTLSGKPYGKVSGKLSVKLIAADGSASPVLEKELTTDDAGLFRADVVAPRAGTLEAQVSLQPHQGPLWTGTNSTLVVGDAGQPVARVPALLLTSTGETLEPGQSADVVALLPEGWGFHDRNEGKVWVTLSGSGLFSSQVVPVKGTSLVHRFHVEKRFGSAVYASLAYPTPSGRWEERTVPFRIVPRQRVLAVTVSPQREEAAPLGEQTVNLRVTDSMGQGVAAELSVSVVDKAIYALQAEFRPGILDFFYPVGRNNVTTFGSSEFQGLGYGDRVAKLFSQLPDHAFASIKPPVKPQREEDTAYWNTSVITDADGRAQVTFKLPSNQTLWTVTAVAADTSGRFGESTGQFATRGTLNLAANLPQFLREGDTAQASIRASLGAKAKQEGTLEVKASLGGALAAAQATQKLTLKAQDEQLMPLSLKAISVGPAQVALQASGLGEPLSDVRHFDVQPAAVDETITVAHRGGGTLQLQLPPDAQVLSSQLVVMPSLLGAAMENLHELLSYPYGCVEQLVSTTVPNVAIYRTLEKAKALGLLDPDARALMAEARSRAVQGTDRILQAAVKGSGFAWWSGSGEVSLPMTLVALDGLSWSMEAGLVARDDVRIVDAADWLSKQDGLPMALAGQRAYVLARIQGNKQAANVRNLLTSTTDKDLYGLAMTVLAAEYAGVNDEPAVRARVQEIATQAGTTFLRPAIWQGDDWTWQFPLGRVGYAAALGHAGSKATGMDEAAARTRALDLLSDPDLSTFDRSTALLHSQWLMERELKTFKASAPPSLDADGVGFVPSAGTFLARLHDGTRSATVGTTDGAIVWKARVRTPLARVTARANGMELQRRYFVLRGNQQVELKADQAVAQGEDVFVELTLNAHMSDHAKWWHRSAYYVLEDSVPAGFTVLEEDKAFRGAPYNLPLTHESVKHRSLSPERATWMFQEPTWWSDSPRVIGYVLRAQFPGTFSAPPAHLEDMYASEISARTGASSLSIKPSGQP